MFESVPPGDAIILKVSMVTNYYLQLQLLIPDI